MDLKKILFFVFLLLIFLVPSIMNIWVDFIWFESVGYLSVFTKILSTKIALGIVGFVVTVGFLYMNLRLTKRFSDLEELRLNVRLAGFRLFDFIVLIAGIGAGFALSSGWKTYLKFINSVPFDKVDPVFAKDLSFYFFDLPFYDMLLNFSIGLFVSGLVLIAGLYYYITRKKMEAEEDFMDVFSVFRNHISVILGFLFFSVAGKIYITKYSLVFSSDGAVFGAAYTDLAVTLPVILISTVLSFVTGIVFLSDLKLRDIKYPAISVFLLIAVVLVGSVAGFVIQSYSVEPNEYNLEKDYIERNINMTLDAYDLSDIDERQFDGTYNLSYSDLQQNPETINNIRLWDWRALKDTYSQLQLIRTYYNFGDVDVDRYKLNGEYKQVMLSPREMDQGQLSEGAQTWTNEHLVYTHGSGVVASPVSEVTEEGLPNLYVKDVPPVVTDNAPGNGSLEIDNPDIYYGEQAESFVITDTTTEEFDYPKGGENVYTTYNGTGGVRIGNFLNRLAMSLHFGDFRLMVSSSVKPESKVLFRRNVDERVKRVAPFLDYDSDPYSVIHDGRIKWIYDAYTTSDRYPYSEPLNVFGEINYIRNSVKVSVDAYNGKMKYHIIDEEDPLIRTYENMFPEMFSNFDEMEEGLKEHVRYPEDLFRIQSHLYSTYHMKDPRVFYNKEDKWTIPNEIYKGSTQPMEPYYVTLKLPKEDEIQFILMMPFTPEGKDNMIGWMGAKSDMPSYGEKVVYQFSKQRLIYGPNQIESRISQDPEISQQITLWSQSGSEVIRGNLLVIPIENSVLYVEPLFLRSSNDAIPELKRVIVAFDDKISMEPTLEDSLNVIFAENETEQTDEIPDLPSDQEGLTTEEKQLVQEAQTHYEDARKYLQEGNFSAYAEEIEALGDVLDRLQD